MVELWSCGCVLDGVEKTVEGVGGWQRSQRSQREQWGG